MSFRRSSEDFKINNQVILIMVGLPAKGKTYIARKISRYLNWLTYTCKIFNVENYRRFQLGTELCDDYFNRENKKAQIELESCFDDTLADTISYIKQGGQISILDGTNVTLERRQKISQAIKDCNLEINQIWVECIIDDIDIQDQLLQQHIVNPDYQRNQCFDKIKELIQNKIKYYNQNYEKLSDNEFSKNNKSYIKITNFGQKVEIHKVDGYLPSKILSLITNLKNFNAQQIYFSRHGESQFNLEDRTGGDSGLSEQGSLYPNLLNKCLQDQLRDYNHQNKIQILTSTLKRAIQTAKVINFGQDPIILKNLNEIASGNFDCMTYDEIKKNYPQDYELRAQNKLTYRYPMGESYVDLIQRLEPIIFEIERSKHPIIIVAHQAVLRCLYAYFQHHKWADIPFLSIPLHTVIQLKNYAYYCKENRFEINVKNNDIKQLDIKNVEFYKQNLDYRKL